MILMRTAAGAPADRVKGLALGADDYLPKPFRFPELVLRIRALARRKPTARSRTLHAAGLELDPLTGTVTRDGQTIKLSAKERAVLEGLLKASPGALSAEQLLAQAWDENVDPFTNTVRVTIARLRRKLGQPDIIHTTPNEEYALTRTRDHALDVPCSVGSWKASVVMPAPLGRAAYLTSEVPLTPKVDMPRRRFSLIRAKVAMPGASAVAAAELALSGIARGQDLRSLRRGR